MQGEITLREQINEEKLDEQTIFADVYGITQSEFAAAGQKDLKPSYKFTVWKFEYNGQTEVEYDGHILTVYRTFEPSVDKIELYTEERKGRR